MIVANIWDTVRQGLGSVLAFFYSIIPNSGVAIILLTVAVRLVLFPLTAKQAKSMIAMQRVQPEIKKLQAKYKNDRQKLNEEMMKFYKENQINPLGGCLPLLLQMPVFIALYQTLRDIQKFIPVDSAMYHDICGKTVPSKCTPDMHFAGMNLTTSASKAMSSGLSVGWPYLVLVAFVVVTGFVQQRQTMRNQTQPNPQMAIISKIFPVVFAFITWGLPSGVGLYFATSNLWQIGQQEVVYRTMMNPASAPPPKKGEGEIEGSAGKGGSGKGGGAATATKSTGSKTGGTKPGASAARAASRGSGSKPAAKPPTKPDAKAGGGGDAKGSANGSKNGNGQARPAGGARSNRTRKR
jgi:YidC/Oxa1 family membrane protein insertase